MAELTMSLTEVVQVLKTTLTVSSDKIKDISLVDKSKIRLVISVSKLFPDIPITLAYQSFSRGIMKFEVTTNYPMKVIQTLISNINLEGVDKDSLVLDDNILSANVRDIMKASIGWLEIKDVKLKNGQFTFVLSPVSAPV